MHVTSPFNWQRQNRFSFFLFLLSNIICECWNNILSPGLDIFKENTEVPHLTFPLALTAEVLSLKSVIPIKVRLDRIKTSCETDRLQDIQMNLLKYINMY